MNTLMRMMALVPLLFFACFTSAKLIKMARIRGFLPGPSPIAETITDKVVLTGRYGDAYWLAWDGAEIRSPGRHRINLPHDAWQSFHVGDRIDLLYFPGDESPHHRADIFAENGNFAFDGVLLAVWLGGIATITGFQIRHHLLQRRRARRRVPRIYSR